MKLKKEDPAMLFSKASQDLYWFLVADISKIIKLRGGSNENHNNKWNRSVKAVTFPNL